MLRLPAAQPGLGDPARDRIGGKQGREAADRKRDCEAAHGTGPEVEEDRTGDQHRQIGIEEAAEGARKPLVDRLDQWLTSSRFLADALVDQHVGVDGNANGQDDCGNARQCQRRAGK
ncbi:hypothetical protein D3C87_1681470 [compost metagenome]